MPFHFGKKTAGHSATTRGNFGYAVQEMARPGRDDHVPEMRDSVRRNNFPSGADISHRLSRPFEEDSMAYDYSLAAEGDNRPQTSRGLSTNREAAKMRQGPARSVTSHNAHPDARISQHGDIQTVRPQLPPLVTNSSYRHEATTTPYPQSVESLYLQCGLISSADFQTFTRQEVNDSLEDWAIDNPVAAAHIMDLAKKWGLHRSFPETLKLTDSGIWKRLPPATREQELEKAYAKGDEWVDEKLGALGRTQSKHLVQKQAVQHRIKQMVLESCSGDVFATSDLQSPMANRSVGMKELPVAVQQLYADVAGVSLQNLSARKMEDMMGDWTRRFPVSDYHLKKVIERWSPEKTERVCISPGYRRVCEEIGPSMVNQRVCAVGDVSVGRIGRSSQTHGCGESSRGSKLRVVNGY
ncbi:MAG: hypothetical protein Q9164_001870 [Protoblastenia rupestris]